MRATLATGSPLYRAGRVPLPKQEWVPRPD